MLNQQTREEGDNNDQLDDSLPQFALSSQAAISSQPIQKAPATVRAAVPSFGGAVLPDEAKRLAMPGGQNLLQTRVSQPVVQ